MPDRSIDRQAWAALLAELINQETRGKKAPFARLVGVDPRSISNWLRGDVDVSEESVRRIATATKRSAVDMLVAVGYYRRDELGPRQPATRLVDYDAEIRRVAEDPALAPRAKVAIIERIAEMRRLDEQRLRSMVDMMIEQAKGA